MKVLKQIFLRPHLYLIITLIGTGLKFYRVDYRHFWIDETSTILHTSGISNQESDQLVPLNEIQDINYYWDLLHLNEQELLIGDQLQGLSQMTNLNPLHYFLLTFWHRVVGDDVVHYRLFNVFIFILCIPVLFLLARKLFNSTLAGWIAVSLFSVSSFYHFYAHEARYNILLTFTLIASHYLLLKALDDKGVRWWIGYTIAAIFAMYASVLSGIVLLGHFLFVMLYQKEYRLAFSFSGFFIFLGYLPWLLSIINNRSEIIGALTWHDWYAQNQNILTLLLAQLTNVARSYVSLNDFWVHMNLMLSGDFNGNYLQLGFMVLVLMVVVYSVIHAYKNLNRKDFNYLIFIASPLFLFFFLSDLVRGTGASLILRYHTATIIGFSLPVAFLLAKKIKEQSSIYIGMYISLLILGFVSVLMISSNKTRDLPFAETVLNDAAFISGSERPLLISDFAYGYGTVDAFLPLANEIENEDVDILRAAPDIENIRELVSGRRYSNIYTISASDQLIANLHSQFPGFIDLIEMDGIATMWRIDTSAISSTSLLATAKAFCNIQIQAIPQTMPSGSIIYITGNHQEFSYWNPSAVPLSDDGDGSWSKTFQIEIGSHLEYKLTLGDWSSEAINTDGSVPGNYTLDVVSDTLITLRVENWKE